MRDGARDVTTVPARILEPSIFNQESWGDVRFADFERTKTLVVLGPVRVKFGNKTLVLGPGSAKFGDKSLKSLKNLKRFIQVPTAST